MSPSVLRTSPPKGEKWYSGILVDWYLGLKVELINLAYCLLPIAYCLLPIA